MKPVIGAMEFLRSIESDVLWRARFGIDILHETLDASPGLNRFIVEELEIEADVISLNRERDVFKDWLTGPAFRATYDGLRFITTIGLRDTVDGFINELESLPHERSLIFANSFPSIISRINVSSYLLGKAKFEDDCLLSLYAFDGLLRDVFDGSFEADLPGAWLHGGNRITELLPHSVLISRTTHFRRSLSGDRISSNVATELRQQVNKLFDDNWLFDRFRESTP